jgi:hypothetical protein
MDVDTSKQGENSDYWLGEPVATSNSFDVLAEEGPNPIGEPSAQTRERNRHLSLFLVLEISNP